jgi:hypothetical protein
MARCACSLLLIGGIAVDARHTEWAKKLSFNNEDFSIDDLIKAVEALVFISDDTFFFIPTYLLEQLKRTPNWEQDRRTRKLGRVMP